MHRNSASLMMNPQISGKKTPRKGAGSKAIICGQLLLLTCKATVTDGGERDAVMRMPLSIKKIEALAERL